MARRLSGIAAAMLLLLLSCSGPAVIQRAPNPVAEMTYEFNVEPEVRIHINRPTFIDSSRKQLVIFYALPNGNTIEMTIGRHLTEGLDWHYNIQHIGAQVRFLRKQLPDYDITVAYLENVYKSWPAWRKAHPDNAELIRRIFDAIAMQQLPGTRYVLAGHSGGGSFLNGFLNAYESIPSDIERIAYLDANYSYDDSLGHGRKMVEWLRADSTHKLCVLAYDDREITFNGKKVVGPDGGTFRATRRMLEYWRDQTDLRSFQDSTILQYSAYNDRSRFIVHTNPDTLILHTVLVERNGFIHAILFNTPMEDVGYKFSGPRAYEQFIDGE